MVLMQLFDRPLRKKDGRPDAKIKSKVKSKVKTKVTPSL